jgi:hypothetical protein
MIVALFLGFCVLKPVLYRIRAAAGFCCGGGLYTARAQENHRATPPREGGGGGRLIVIEAIGIAFVVSCFCACGGARHKWPEGAPMPPQPLPRALRGRGWDFTPAPPLGQGQGHLFGIPVVVNGPVERLFPRPADGAPDIGMLWCALKPTSG